MRLQIDEFGNVRINGKYIGYDPISNSFTGLEKLNHKERFFFNRDIMCVFTDNFRKKLKKKYKVLYLKQLSAVIEGNWPDKSELTKYYQDKLQELTA